MNETLIFSDGESKERTNPVYSIFSLHLHDSPIHKEIGTQGD